MTDSNSAVKSFCGVDRLDFDSDRERRLEVGGDSLKRLSSLKKGK